MALRFGFAGFGHGHIFSLHKQVTARDDLEFAGAFEDDLAARSAAQANGVDIGFDTIDALSPISSFTQRMRFRG